MEQSNKEDSLLKYEYGVVDAVFFFFVTHFLLFLGHAFAMGLIRGILNNKVGIDEANEIADKELETCTWIRKLFQTYILKYVPEKKKSFLFYNFLVSIYLLCMITLPMHVVVYFITGYTMTGSISDIIINKYLVFTSFLFLTTLVISGLQDLVSDSQNFEERPSEIRYFKSYERAWKKWTRIKEDDKILYKAKRKVLIDAGTYLSLTASELLKRYDIEKIQEGLENIYRRLIEFNEDAIQYKIYGPGFFDEKVTQFTNDLWIFPDETYVQIQRIRKSYDCTDQKSRKKCLGKIDSELYFYAMNLNNCVKKTDKIGYICELTQENLTHAVDAFEDLLQRYLIAMDTENQFTERAEEYQQDIAYYRECIAERQKILEENNNGN